MKEPAEGRKNLKIYNARFIPLFFPYSSHWINTAVVLTSVLMSLKDFFIISYLPIAY